MVNGQESLLTLVRGFYLQLANDSIKVVNRQVGINDNSYTKKATIQCGLALGIICTWRIT